MTDTLDESHWKKVLIRVNLTSSLQPECPDIFLNFPLNVCHHGYDCCCYHHCHYFAWRIIPGGSRWLLRNCLEMPFWECGSVPESPKHWEVWACMGNKNNPCTDLPKETVNRHANIQSDMKCRKTVTRGQWPENTHPSCESAHPHSVSMRFIHI